MLLSRQPRSYTSRLAWLKRIPIAVPSGRINQNCYGNTCHKHRYISYFGTWRLARFHRFIERRSQEVTVSGFLGSPYLSRSVEGNCSLPEFVLKFRLQRTPFGPHPRCCRRQTSLISTPVFIFCRRIGDFRYRPKAPSTISFYRSRSIHPGSGSTKQRG